MADGPPGRHAVTRHRARLLRIAGLAISVVALSIVFQSMDLAAAARILAGADVLVLVGVLAVLVVQLLLRAYRWRILLPHRPDGQVIPVVRVIPPLLAGYLGNAVLPARLGEPIRAALIARRERLDTLEAFGTTITERVVDTATLAVVAFVAAVVVGAESWILVLAGIAAAAGVVIIVLLVTVGLTAVALFVGRVLGRTTRSWAGSVSRWGLAFATGVDRGRAPGRLAAVVLISCICWAIDGTVFWLVAQSLEVTLTWPAALLVAAVTVLGTAVPSAPGYVGTFELAATTTALALGVPKPEGLALAILAHVMTIVPLAIAGAIAALAMGTGLSKLSREAETDDRDLGPADGRTAVEGMSSE